MQTLEYLRPPELCWLSISVQYFRSYLQPIQSNFSVSSSRGCCRGHEGLLCLHIGSDGFRKAPWNWFAALIETNFALVSPQDFFVVCEYLPIPQMDWCFIFWGVRDDLFETLQNISIILGTCSLNSQSSGKHICSALSLASGSTTFGDCCCLNIASVPETPPDSCRSCL